MATRPVQDFHWADVGGSIVDPGAPKKDLGFVTAERPPASWFNYLFNLIQQWITYFDDSFTETRHGSIEVPLDLTQRLVQAGTWTINNAGVLVENTNTARCRVPITIPIGSTITGFRLRGQQTGATDLFAVEISSSTSISAGSPAPISGAALSDGVTTGTQQDASVTGESLTTDGNTRYFLEITTAGAGAGNRILTGGFVTYQRG